jgi:hypothetical protein
MAARPVGGHAVGGSTARRQMFTVTFVAQHADAAQATHREGLPELEPAASISSCTISSAS